MNYHGKQLQVKRVLNALGIRISQATSSEYYAHCPFHTDTNPSFAVNKKTGLWMCHKGCGAGNITQLWHLMTGDNMMASVRQLLQLASAYSQTEMLKLLNTQAFQPTTKYRQVVLENYDPAYIHPYWTETRGFDEPFSREWDVGYDKMRRAVVIPVRDPWGMVVGATRRLIHPLEGENKYHHDHGTPRNSILFGLHRAGNSRVLILTEGPTSCLRLHQYGFDNAVAVFGSSISAVQIRMVLQRAHTVTLFFDNDEAGAIATDKIATQLQDKMAVFIAKYPPDSTGCDPADLSVSQVRYALTNAMWYSLWLMQQCEVNSASN